MQPDHTSGEYLLAVATRPCRSHPERTAVAACGRCHAALCAACRAEAEEGSGPAPGLLCAECSTVSEAEHGTAEETEARTAPQPICVAHPDRPSVMTCDRCGDFLCSACALPSPWDYQTYCASCVERLEAQGGGGRIAWEEDSLGFWKRFWRTCTGVLGNPGDFFRAMPSKGYLPAVTFQYAASTAFLVLTLLFTFATLGAKVGINALSARALGWLALWVGGAVALVPILTFLTSGLWHLNLFVFGARRGFAATYRCASYLSAVAILYAVIQAVIYLRIPMVGLILSFGFLGYVVFVASLAAARSQRLGTGVAAAATILYGVEAYLLERFVIKPLLGG